MTFDEFKGRYFSCGKWTCAICGEVHTGRGEHGFGAKHLPQVHSVSAEKFILKYVYDGYPQICRYRECHNPTKFINISSGFSHYCSRKCRMLEMRSRPEFESKRVDNFNVMIQSPEESKKRSDNMIKLNKDPAFSSKARINSKQPTSTQGKINITLSALLKSSIEKGFGWVYITLVSDSAVKIGCTGNPYTRPFEYGSKSLYLARHPAEDAAVIEQYLLNISRNYVVSDRRSTEFRRIGCLDIPAILSIIS